MISDAVFNDVLSAVDGQWRRSREIWGRMGVWAPETVRQTLAALTEQGVCESRREPTPQGGYVLLFRRKP